MDSLKLLFRIRGKDMNKSQIPANFNSLFGNVNPDTISDAYTEYRKFWVEFPKRHIVRNFPMHLDIEANNTCNLRCTFCDKLPNIRKDSIGYMDMELFKKIIDEGVAYQLWGIKLSYRGEPLLHKDIVKMVSYAKSAGILDVYFNTNGMLLNKGIVQQLIDAGLDRISVSIEGTDPEAFEKERVGANFEVILNNIKLLRSIRQENKSAIPKIRVQSVWLQTLDVQKYREFWASFADEVAVIDFKDESRRKTGIISDEWSCPQLYQRMTIEWDGSVFGCNNDDKRKLYMGNVMTRSIYDCWHDSRLTQARDAHKAGKSHTVESCDGCPWRTSQIEKDGYVL